MLVVRMIEFMLLILLGFILYRIKVFDEVANQTLSNLILKVTMPAMILSSVMTTTEFQTFSLVFYVLFVAILLFLILPLIAMLLSAFLRVEHKKRGVYNFMTMYGNIGFMGFPVIEALLGKEAIFYMALFNMIFFISTFSMGVYLMSDDGKKALHPKLLLTPGILASILALILYLTRLHFPTALVSCVSSLGSITTPLSMLMIGSSLATMPLKNIFTDARDIVYVLLRQCVLPLMIYPLLCLLIQDRMVRSVVFVIFLLPIASSAVLFATQYGKDVMVTSRCVFLSTLISFICIPLFTTIFL